MKRFKQIARISIAAASLVLIIVWLCLPGWNPGKIVGIIADLLLFLSMVISYKAEEKKKKQK